MVKILIVLLAIGLGAAWGVCHFTTPCYEARCECEVSFGRPSEGGFEETLNTRLAAWQSDLGEALEGVERSEVGGLNFENNRAAFDHAVMKLKTILQQA